MRDGLLRVTAAGYQRHCAIPDFPAGRIGADCDDLAGAFHADNFRRAGRRRVESLALEQICAIHAGGVCVFSGNFAAGDYAVTLFHDEDSSGKFKSNFVGYPLEGYGFSNNVVPQFSAPTFDQCKFHYDGTGWTQIPVKMIYR